MADLNERSDMYQRNPFTAPDPNPAVAGLRPSMARLVRLVDTDDPAFPCIVDVLKDMQAGGIELTEATVDMAVKLGRQKRERSRSHGRTQGGGAAPGGIVYYIRRGKFIKIGTTTSPRTRFRALLPDEILAFEPGGPEEEFKRHMQFLHLRVSGRSEHFESREELLAHTALLREQHGEPDPSWPTTGNLSGVINPYMTEVPVSASGESTTVAEGARRLGLKQFTVYGWARRGRLTPVGVDVHGRRLYSLDQMATLAKLNHLWTVTRSESLG